MDKNLWVSFGNSSIWTTLSGMQTINWEKADAWIDSYVQHISNKNDIPTKYARTWLELEAEKVGLVQNGRGWEFGESHAAWYAALIKTKRLHKVNRLEKEIFRTNNQRTTLSTVNKLLKGRMRDTVAAYLLRKMLGT
jgi:ribosomal protein L28